MAQVKIHGITKEYPEGTTRMEAVRGHQKEYGYNVLLVWVNGKLQELREQVKDCELFFVTAEDKSGMSAYQRSASLIMLKTLCSVMGPGNAEKLVIDSSIGRGFLMEVRGNFVLDQEFPDVVKAEMKEYMERKVFIMKRGVSTDDAIEFFEKLGMYDKARLFRYRMVPRVNIHNIDGFEDYYYGCMVQNTGYIGRLDLIPHHYGFVMVIPDRNTPGILHKSAPSDKLFATLPESMKWGGRMDLKTVGALNSRIAEGDMPHLILIQEALQGKKITEIAAQTAARKNARSIMIAGPSSSDKTTLSHRLSVQLKVIGLRFRPIVMGSCFVNRVDSLRDEHDNYNYEILECPDVELSNWDVTGLLEGKRVELLYYDFKKRVREYKGDFLQLGEGDILVVEGIHYLNDRLSYILPADSKFKIYVSALTWLSIDERNRIPTTDGQLLRGMVRDARTRGSSARGTIRMWPSVRRGGEESIFLPQEGADAMLNSAFAHELAVPKQYAQPLLFTVPRDNEEQLEVRRLLKFLDYSIDANSEDIPENSILREFIDGNCLNV